MHQEAHRTAAAHHTVAAHHIGCWRVDRTAEVAADTAAAAVLVDRTVLVQIVHVVAVRVEHRRQKVAVHKEIQVEVQRVARSWAASRLKVVRLVVRRTVVTVRKE